MQFLFPQSEAQGLSASASPGEWLESTNIGLHPRHPESASSSQQDPQVTHMHIQT